MAEKEYISYNDIVADCKDLAGQIKGNGFDKIVAVTRGGMVPACLLAQFLGIKQMGSIALVSYDEQNQAGQVRLLVAPNLEVDERTLFVDDLYDSGSTYKYIKQQYSQAKIAVTYSKNQNAKLDFPAKPKPANNWIVFPWEFEKI